MAKKQFLQGSVEEQAQQLYDMALEAMEEGRYTAAYRDFEEIERALPGFKDVPERLAQARQAKREQRWLLWGSLLGAVVFIILARVLGARSELVFLAAAAAGLVIGFAVTLVLVQRPSRRVSPPPKQD